MYSLETLSSNEKNLLLKFPAYISFLAANKDFTLDKKSRKAAVKFCHIKTYTCNPLLLKYYQQAEKVFEKNIDELEKKLPENKTDREKIIYAELERIEDILLKLEWTYALAMHRSMQMFKEHVSKAHRHVLEYFIFPLPIKGLTD